MCFFVVVVCVCVASAVPLIVDTGSSCLTLPCEMFDAVSTQQTHNTNKAHKHTHTYTSTCTCTCTCTTVMDASTHDTLQLMVIRSCHCVYRCSCLCCSGCCGCFGLSLSLVCFVSVCALFCVCVCAAYVLAPRSLLCSLP